MTHAEKWQKLFAGESIYEEEPKAQHHGKEHHHDGGHGGRHGHHGKHHGPKSHHFFGPLILVIVLSLHFYRLKALQTKLNEKEKVSQSPSIEYTICEHNDTIQAASPKSSVVVSETTSMI